MIGPLPFFLGYELITTIQVLLDKGFFEARDAFFEELLVRCQRRFLYISHLVSRLEAKAVSIARTAFNDGEVVLKA